MATEVVLLPSLAAAEYWRKRAASERGGSLLGVAATTFGAWIADLWELHGDGRALVDDMMRRMLMRRAWAEMQKSESPVPAGLIAAAADCARRASGVEAFERAISDAEAGCADDALDAHEQALLCVIARYRRILAARGFAETGEAAAWLAHRAESVFPRDVRVRWESAVPLDWQQQMFFAACPQLELEMRALPDVQMIGRAPAEVALRFAYPSGPSAQAALVADIVRTAWGVGHPRIPSSAENGTCGWFSPRTVVACKDPLGMQRALERALVQKGMAIAAQGRMPFARTDFGRAFIALYRCLHDVPWDPTSLTDVLLSPFLGLTKRDAYDIDRQLRGDRMSDREGVLAQLRIMSEPFSQMEELASDPEADVLIGVFEQAVQARADLGAAWRAEQLSALAALRKATSAARAAGQPMTACIDELMRASITVTFRSAADASEQDKREAPLGSAVPDVLIASQEDAAALGPHACDVLVVTDLTTDDYPVADRDDAVSTLLERLGLAPADDALARARRTFGALLNLPADQLILMRPLNDRNAEAAYPCLVLDEFIDAYRADPTATDDVDNPYHLPADLQVGMLERSEDALFENAVALPVGQRQEAQSASSVANGISGANGTATSPILLPRRLRDGSVLAQACPSPSAIEAYLECPRRWFIDRRLDARSLDEAFGPIEKGLFAHEALQTFYVRFQEEDFAKVTPSNLERARTLMAAIVDGLEAAQYEREPGRRLVPASELERHELAALKAQLVGYLDFEARLLPAFHPAFLEFEIPPERAIDYAGFKLMGIVDRIDIDDAGHAVIIDYKGSCSAAHGIAGKTPRAMGKVQTRIYAQGVKRALGLDVIGALYVTYGRNPQVIGAYDPRIIGEADLPGARAETCSCAVADEGLPAPSASQDEAFAILPPDLALESLTFAHMLDATELVVGSAIARMQAGDVSPAPSSSEVCRYCVAPICGKRGGA